MSKIILTGSAPYFPKWWEEHKDKLKEFSIHSINNSVLLTKDVCDLWWCSYDFFAIHPEINPNIVEERCFNFRWAKGDWSIWYDKGETSGTMLFNVLEALGSSAVYYGEITEVNVIGCDLIYKEGEQNHFYGNGTPDPMRLGLPLILKNIEYFKDAFKKYGIGLYNLSPQPESLLTFERRVL